MRAVHLTRFPVAIDLGVYEQVASSIEDHVARIPQVVSIYSAGGFSAPGISDVDRIVVVRANTGPIPSIWPQLSEVERYVALHTPFLVDVETFQVHRWFANFEPLQCRFGETIHFDDPPDDPLLRQRLGIEHLVNMRVWLEKSLFSRRIDVRPMLCLLHNLRHDLPLVGLVESTVPSVWWVVHEIESLRSTWFLLDRAEQSTRILGARDAAVEGIDAALSAWAASRAGPDRARIRLRGVWHNVELVDAPRQRLGRNRVRLAGRIAPRSRRAAELRWRATSHPVPAPGAVIGFLGSGADTELLRIRARYVARYSAFASASPGWSTIGLGAIV